ncbi:MAG: 4-hydroxy-tetrahydrodipicolinate synthase [bacterium]
MKIRGTFTALITPFKNNEVDYEGLKENIQFQIKNGISGILPLGTTGETPTLNKEEQKKIIQVAVKEAGGKIPVMIGTGSNSTDHTIENTQRAKQEGADLALIVTPYYNKPTQEGIFQHFQTVTETVDIPVIVYNIKGRTGTNIETSTLKRLAALPNIVGVKEASGDIMQMGDVIDQIKSEFPDFSVMSGDDKITLSLLALGGDGVISVISNLIPAQVSRMIEAGLKGDFETARKMHYELLPLMKGAFVETNPVPIKAAMEMCGKPAGEVRLPLCGLQPESKAKLTKVLQDMGLLS